LVWINTLESAPSPYTCQKCSITLIWRRAPYIDRTGTYAYRREECDCERAAREAEELAERKQLTLRNLRAYSGITGWLCEASFENIEARPGIEEAIKAARAFTELPLRNDTLIFSGAFGCGKTHLAAAICNVLVEKLVRVRWLNADQYMQACLGAWRTHGEKIARPDEPPKDAPLLVLDELAPSKIEPAWQSDLYAIINPRYQSQLPMIVTTNQRTPSALGDAIGGRLLDRLLHRARWVDITASSYRMREYSERKRG